MAPSIHLRPSLLDKRRMLKTLGDLASLGVTKILFYDLAIHPALRADTRSYTLEFDSAANEAFFDFYRTEVDDLDLNLQWLWDAIRVQCHQAGYVSLMNEDGHATSLRFVRPGFSVPVLLRGQFISSDKTRLPRFMNY